MNGEWIFQLALVLVTSLVTAIVGYILGLKSQKIQVLREYITETVADVYPTLFSEMKRNSELLDNFLEKPNVNFDFPDLDGIYSSGLAEFMKRHHRDLFLMVDSFRKKFLPKFYGLSTLFGEVREKIFNIWSEHLRKSLPRKVVDTSESIANDLCKTINPNYVLPDLLSKRDGAVRNKIERCILNRTSHIYRKKAEKPYVIREQQKEINLHEILQSLIDKAKPEIANLIRVWKELKKQNDIEVKEKLLPLLEKIISYPI